MRVGQSARLISNLVKPAAASAKRSQCATSLLLSTIPNGHSNTSTTPTTSHYWFSKRQSTFTSQHRQQSSASASCRISHSSTSTNTNTQISTMAQLIDGKQIAEDIRGELRTEIEKWVADGHRAPQLTCVLVGEDPASQTYVRNKMKAALEVGICSRTTNLPSTISEPELLAVVAALNTDPAVDGILVQLPLPPHINERRICNAVRCDKDVDGFNERNVGRLTLDMHALIPCTPLGVVELLKRTGIETFGKNAVVVGRSKNVGLPIAVLLHADGRNETRALDATVTMCHRFTPPEQLKAFCLLADIIVSATGVPGLIRADMVKPGACIIDVGLTRVVDKETGKGKLVGDVEFEEVRKVAGHITPVPGGVGPMTVAMLMRNTFAACRSLAAEGKEEVEAEK